MGKTLYIDCSSGISGDMTVGMLIDLGADTSVLCEAISSLPLEGATIEISHVDKKGVAACDFDVKLDASIDNHDHDMEYLHGHTLDEHHHENHHEHRTLSDVCSIIDGGSLSERANSIAKKIFSVLAEAEAHAHETTPDKVHFHEVGAVDSIIDIVSIAVCIDNLDITDVIVEEISEGEGTIRTQHGILDIPVPAVKYLLDAYSIKVNELHIRGEHITPTGASVVAALRTSDIRPGKCEVCATGTGAGKRDYESAGILRGYIVQ